MQRAEIATKARVRKKTPPPKNRAYIIAAIMGRHPSTVDDIVKLKNQLEGCGWVITNIHFHMNLSDYPSKMRDNLRALIDSDCVFVLNTADKAWESLLERDVAQKLNIPFYEEARPYAKNPIG